jgi:hypothetical protein
MAVEVGVSDVRHINIAALRSELTACGMELDPGKHQAFAPEVTPDPMRGA